MEADIIKKYSDMALKLQRTKEESYELLDAIGTALAEGVRYQIPLTWLIKLTTSIVLTDDDKAIDEILRLIHEFKSLAAIDSEHAAVDYCLLILYLQLGFAPKIVDTALIIIENESSNAIQRYVAYTELGNASVSCGLYTRALEFYNSTLDYCDICEESLGFLYRITSEGNICDTLSFLHEYEEVEKHKAIIRQLLEENKDRPETIGLATPVEIDFIAADIRTNGLNTDHIAKYTGILNDMKEGIIQNRHNYVLHSLPNDIYILRQVKEAGYYRECVGLCQSILFCSNSFSGDKTEIYHILVELWKIDNSLFDEAQYYKYMVKYTEWLEKYYTNNISITRHLLNEEFRIYDINNAYDMMKAKYETDPLTVCYNRPSFEVNAATFMRDHPEGCIVFIDIDGLKYTNDHFGHSAGDFLLKTFVQVTNNTLVKEKDRLYRYAGDEFIVVTSRNKVDAEELINTVVNNLSTPYDFNDNKIEIRFSYGITGFYEEGEPLNEDYQSAIHAVVKKADALMYECKRRHKEENPNFVRM